MSKILDINNLLLSNKISSRKKTINTLLVTFTLITEIKPLHIMFPKTKAYAKSYDSQTKGMYFLIEGDDLLEKYNNIWDKFGADIKKGFHSKTVYKKILENKMKSNGDIATDFHNKEIPKEYLFSSTKSWFCS